MTPKSHTPMNDAVHKQEAAPDQPLLDTTPYGSGKDDSISDATENAAITQHTLTIDGTKIPHTARAGHLVIADQYSARPTAKIFYVAFTANVTPQPVVLLPSSIMEVPDLRRSISCLGRSGHGELRPTCPTSPHPPHTP